MYIRRNPSLTIVSIYYAASTFHGIPLYIIGHFNFHTAKLQLLSQLLILFLIFLNLHQITSSHYMKNQRNHAAETSHTRHTAYRKHQCRQYDAPEDPPPFPDSYIYGFLFSRQHFLFFTVTVTFACNSRKINTLRAV